MDNDNRVTIRLEPDQLANLEAFAAMDERSISFLVRKAIEQYLRRRLSVTSPDAAEAFRQSVRDAMQRRKR